MKKIIIISIIIFPALVWAAYKPARILAPELVPGITCKSDTICLDDISRYHEAVTLYNEALVFVESTVGVIKEEPKVLFCSTQSCFKSFGFNKASAKTIGTSGIVISPKGWKYYYLRHEMIHHLQAEKMGVISLLLRPDWFTEGMAYSLSEDPREKLSTPHQAYREKFSVWYKAVQKENLWEASL